LFSILLIDSYATSVPKVSITPVFVSNDIDNFKQQTDQHSLYKELQNKVEGTITILEEISEELDGDLTDLIADKNKINEKTTDAHDRLGEALFMTSNGIAFVENQEDANKLVEIMRDLTAASNDIHQVRVQVISKVQQLITQFNQQVNNELLLRKVLKPILDLSLNHDQEVKQEDDKEHLEDALYTDDDSIEIVNKLVEDITARVTNKQYLVKTKEAAEKIRSLIK